MNPRPLNSKLQTQKYLIIGKSLNMRLVEIQDASYILELRSNVKKNKFLTPIKQNLKAQQEWIMRYKQREAEGLEYYFLIESKAMQHLGVVRIYDFTKDNFYWGSWIIQENAPAPTAIESALNIYSFAFEVLGFTQSHFDVRKENARVVAFHQRCGAKIVREDALNYYFHFSKEDFTAMKVRYVKYLPLLNGGGVE